MSTFVLMYFFVLFLYFLYFCTFVIYLDYPYELPCKIWSLQLKKWLSYCTRYEREHFLLYIQQQYILADRYAVLLSPLFFKFLLLLLLLLLLLFQKKITKPQPQQSVRYKSPIGPVSCSQFHLLMEYSAFLQKWT